MEGGFRLSSFKEGKPKSLSRRWIYAAVTASVILVVFASMFVLASNQYENDKENPPIPVVTEGHHFYTTVIGNDYCAIIIAKVRNDGGAGIIIAEAMVKQDTGGSIFRKSQEIFFESGEEKEIAFVFPEVVPQPCANRHAIKHAFGVRVP
jgi:hypothetical protein